jgi:cell wall-associated NlpC family hydrolase
MAKEPLTRWARRIALAAATVAMVATVFPAYAAPGATGTPAFRKELFAKQAQVDAVNAKLDDLDRESEIASEEFNKASVQLEQTTADLDAAQNDLNNTRAALVVQDEILAKRLANIYRDGNLTAFEVLLDSKSVGDFIGRVKFLNTLSTSDANKAAGLKSQKILMEAQFKELQAAQARAQELSFELKAREVEVDLRIAEQQSILDAVEADVRSLIDAEAAKRDGQQSVLLQQVLSGASKTGIVATPGSPVETALAYHGVPYLWGGATPSAFDCSGLVLYVFGQHGVQLPHYSGFQFLQGEKIPVSQIQPNDVVFFGSPVHHVGIYVGGGYFIHAPKRNDFVKITKLAERNDIAGVRRYPWVARTAPIKGAQSSTGSALNAVR